MIRSDYIVRQIEMLGIFFAAIRRRILTGSIDGASIRQDLAQAASDSGFDFELLVGLNKEALFMAVAPAGEVDSLRCWMVAEILYLHGLQTAREENPDAAIDSLTKARVFYEMALPQGALMGFPEAQDRLSEVDSELEALGVEVDQLS